MFSYCSRIVRVLFSYCARMFSDVLVLCAYCARIVRGLCLDAAKGDRAAYTPLGFVTH